MNNPESILVNKEELTLEGIRQFYIKLDQYNWKFDVLFELYETINITQSIIYIPEKGAQKRRSSAEAVQSECRSAEALAEAQSRFFAQKRRSARRSRSKSAQSGFWRRCAEAQSGIALCFCTSATRL